jgi:hypothetical protein
VSSASAAPSLATLAAPFGPALAAWTASAVLTARSATPAATAVLADVVGAHPASVRVPTGLVATTEVAASPGSDLGSI